MKKRSLKNLQIKQEEFNRRKKMKYKIGDKVVLYDWDELGEMFDMDYNTGVFLINKYFNWSPDSSDLFEYLDEERIVRMKTVTISNVLDYDGKFPYYEVEEVSCFIPEEIIKGEE